ncbi:ribonuclease E inhibitor RraB [uncultured Serinicoccus sp.]|uniref:ribonuclease E inhibitor RraB n=1 Tax=uncultured Serinicoccus sp. TaxID=735514 RepID=UPI0026194DA5|nr:ribonuclease E inhibitor RraB [uncultured Serinicoccus sp.]
MTTAQPPRPGSEHLVAMPDRAEAESVAEDLDEEGFRQVRVVPEGESRRGQGESAWVVHVRDTRLPDAAGGGAYEALRERFTDLAREHDGWYDEPGDPRPATR